MTKSSVSSSSLSNEIVPSPARTRDASRFVLSTSRQKVRLMNEMNVYLDTKRARFS